MRSMRDDRQQVISVLELIQIGRGGTKKKKRESHPHLLWDGVVVFRESHTVSEGESRAGGFRSGIKQRHCPI